MEKHTVSRLIGAPPGATFIRMESILCAALTLWKCRVLTLFRWTGVGHSSEVDGTSCVPHRQCRLGVPSA